MSEKLLAGIYEQIIGANPTRYRLCMCNLVPTSQIFFSVERVKVFTSGTLTRIPSKAAYGVTSNYLYRETTWHVYVMLTGHPLLKLATVRFS